METNQQDENAKEKAIKQLEEDLAGYKVSFEKAKEELKNLQDTLPIDLAQIQRDIDADLETKKEIEENALETFNKIGLQGTTLIDALTQVRFFARSMKPGASAYAPFAAILNCVYFQWYPFYPSLIIFINFLQPSKCWSNHMSTYYPVMNHLIYS